MQSKWSTDLGDRAKFIQTRKHNSVTPTSLGSRYLDKVADCTKAYIFFLSCKAWSSIEAHYIHISTESWSILNNGILLVWKAFPNPSLLWETHLQALLQCVFRMDASLFLSSPLLVVPHIRFHVLLEALYLKYSCPWLCYLCVLSPDFEQGRWMEMKSNYNNIFCVISFFFSALRAYCFHVVITNVRWKERHSLTDISSSVAGLNKIVEEFLRISARACIPANHWDTYKFGSFGWRKTLVPIFFSLSYYSLLFFIEVETFICHEI